MKPETENLIKKQSHPPCFQSQEVEWPSFVARLNLTLVCQTTMYLFKRNRKLAIKRT